MKIGALTSSRADYGIYRPLFKKLMADPFFDLQVLAFGTHLSKRFGYTITEIEQDHLPVLSRIETVPDTDTPSAVSFSMAKTIAGFTKVWSDNNFDLVIALGDRYEMFSAVASSVPFNIPVAHIHGGETTLGALDNAFRHSITHFSKIHFASCEQYRERIVQMTGSELNVYNAGALCMDSLKNTETLSIEDFYSKYSIDLRLPTILLTFHPETVSPEKNTKYVEEIEEVIRSLNDWQIVITMPNADIMGLLIRESFLRLEASLPNVHCVENFGSQGYFTCMKHCRFMLGNTSSGFYDALFFNKPVVNLGSRQKGRIETANIITCGITKAEIFSAIQIALEYKSEKNVNIYGSGETAKFITEKLRDFYTEKKE